MGVFEMIAVVVVAGCAAQAFKAWVQHRDTGSSGDPAQQQRIDDLERRVRHLEAVVTDPDSQLREKFRELEAE